MKKTAEQIRRFAGAFKDARDRGANQMKMWLFAMAILALPALAETPATSTAPATPAASRPSSSLITLLETMPEDMRPAKGETTAAANRRAAWIKTNVVGKTVSANAKLRDVEETFIWFFEFKDSIFGQVAGVYVKGQITLDAATKNKFADSKTGDTIVVTGVVSDAKASLRGGKIPLSIEVEFKSPKLSKP